MGAFDCIGCLFLLSGWMAAKGEQKPFNGRLPPIKRAFRNDRIEAASGRVRWGVKRYVSFEKTGLGCQLGCQLGCLRIWGILPQSGKNDYIKTAFS